MKPAPRSLSQVLDSLSQRDLLQCLAYADQRKAQLERLQGLLQDRLAQMVATTTDSTRDHGGELMTVPDMAKVVKLGNARAYELVRSGVIPGVRIGVRQIRVRRADLDRYLQPRNGRV